MSIRFAIKNTESPAEKEGDSFIRYSGVSEPFRRISERYATKVGVDGGGNPKIIYVTGLDDKKVKFFKWYTEDEQKAIIKQIKELKPVISDFFGGEDVLSESNRFFWGDNRDVNRLSLSNEDMNVFYDTKNPAHALLYLSIISGAFMEMVAPTKDWAERNVIPHYLVLETEEEYDDDEGITKSDAHAALSALRKEANPESLFILAWCLQYDTSSYGAYLKSTPVKTLVNYHINYIDGKLQTKKKRNCPKLFMEYAEKWKGQQTRPALYTEAYVKAGEYYSFLVKRNKKFETLEGEVLGNTIDEAVANLTNPKFNQEFEKLRDMVEAKWKE
jgi:hypothetical protein